MDIEVTKHNMKINVPKMTDESATIKYIAYPASLVPICVQSEGQLLIHVQKGSGVAG